MTLCAVCQMYITMCEKAEELQKLWKPQVGDWFYKRDGIGFGLWLICKIEEGVLLCSGERMGQLLSILTTGQVLVEFRVPEAYIWLPRQDQLQALFEEPSINLLNRFHSWCNGSYPVFPHTPPAHFASMEQLWLGFVMEELYQKVWDGGDWVAERREQ